MPSRLLAPALLATIFLSPAALAAPSANETAILQIEQAMTAAQTVQQATKTWDKNVVLDDMVALNGQTSHYVGLAAAQADFAPQFAGIGQINTKILTISVYADNNLGFAFSTQHLLAKGKNGAPGLDVVFRETDCFQKKAGKWVLIHQQLSVPFDPKTGKAIFNSN